MTRSRFGARTKIGKALLLSTLAVTLVGSPTTARAQQKEASPPAAGPTPPAPEPTPPEPSVPGSEPSLPGSEPTPPGSEPTPPGQKKPEAAPPGQAPKVGGRLGSVSWRDIVTVPRRPILKFHRVELIPTYNVSLNNSVVREHTLGGIVNFFLSETLNIGLEASYHQPQLLEHYTLRGLDDRVLPSANRFIWSAALNFGYVPIYGKFALFNKFIFQWETYIQAGLGVIESQWIPRDPANSAQNNFDVLWHVDLGWRMFLTKWLAIHVYLKDYMLVDSFEPADRVTKMAEMGGKVPAGDSVFVQNLVFGVGVGMFLPTGFDYKFTR